MALGVSYSINVDGQQGLGVLNAFQSQFKSMGDTARKELGQKLKTAVSLATIEEATRRTGEWAQNLDKTAQAMWTTSEKLQAMNLLASMSNVDESKVTGFFDELDAKRRDAVQGNQELIQSFQALGISYQDLTSLSKSDLFGKLLSSGKVQGLVAGTPMGNAAESLVGQGNIPILKALNGTAGGKDLNSFAGDAKDKGEIADNQDVADMSATWQNIKQDLSQALLALSPIGKILLNLASILSGSILGAITVLKDIFGVIAGLLTGNMEMVGNSIKSFGGILMNGVFGLLKTITGLIDLVAGTISKYARMIPGGKKLFGEYGTGITGLVQEGQDALNKKFNIGRNEIKGGEGLGNLGAIIGTGGTGAAGTEVASVASNALLKGAGIAEKYGAAKVSETLLSGAAKLDGYVGGTGVAGKVTNHIFENRAAKEGESYINEYADRKLAIARKGDEGMTDEEAASLRAKYKEEGIKDYMKSSQLEALAIKASGIAGIAGNVAAIGLGVSTSHGVKGVAPEDQKFHGVVTNQAPTNFQGESSSMLKLGGVYGTGIQSRIIRLNEQMVSLLAQISRNTSYNNATNVPLPSTNPNAHNTGGF